MGWNINGYGYCLTIENHIKEIQQQIINYEKEDSYDTFSNKIKYLKGKIDGLKIALEIAQM